MSGVSSAMAISVYLTASKNEQAQVANFVKSDATTRAAVSGFESSAATLGSSSAILANYKALQVLTGAYNMSGQINSRAILSDLMTQSADSTGSLVQKSANTDYLHFARATQDRATQTAALGGSGPVSLTTTGANASVVTMQNTAWSSSATPTKAAPAVQWSFVTNDGSAGASIDAALNSASKAAGSSGGYTIGTNGVVSSPPGGASVTTSTDSEGNVTYSLPVSTDSSGNVIKRVDVVSVAVAAGTSPSASTAQLQALTGAMTAAGFDATLSATNQLAVMNPATSGVNTLADTFGTAIATATATTMTPSGQLALGTAGKGLTAGQVLTDGKTVIGTIKSVDGFGNVTLAAAAAITPAAGDTIEVATGLSFSNLGAAAITTAAAAAGAKTIALGTSGTGLKPGQVISSTGVAIGTVASVDPQGNVTLQAGSAAALAKGAALVVSPAISAAPTAALRDAKNVSSIVSSFETNAYEASMGTQYTGLDDALYYTRTMGSITSITQLMSNSRLLSVVTTSLGMGSYFAELDYTQQVSLLTSKVDLKEMTSAAGIKKTSLQYLITQAANTTTTPTGIAALFSSDSLSSVDMFGLANGISPSSSTTNDSGTDPVLSLFT